MGCIPFVVQLFYMLPVCAGIFITVVFKDNSPNSNSKEEKIKQQMLLPA